MSRSKWCDLAKEAAWQGALAIMPFYQNLANAVYEKADRSVVTQADHASHQAIVTCLRSASDYPILSEEGQAPDDYRHAQHLWVVDPLDGTRNFLAADGGFVVNIALLEQGVPVVGVMMAPVRDQLFFAIQGQGAYCQVGDRAQRLQVSAIDDPAQAGWLVSRFHAASSTEDTLQALGAQNIQLMGSALKYCLIANGEMDASMRRTPLMEWDVCAADCLLHEAGGRLTDLAGQRLRYQQADPRISSGILASNGVLHDVILSQVGAVV